MYFQRYVDVGRSSGL